MVRLDGAPNDHKVPDRPGGQADPCSEPVHAYLSTISAVVGPTTTEVAATMVSVPLRIPAASTAPPPLGTRCIMVAPSCTVTGEDDGFTNTLPFAKSRR